MLGFGLTFRRGETERQYMQWVIEGGLRRVDCEALWVGACLCWAYVLRYAFAPESPQHVPLMGFAGVHFAREAVAWRRMSVEELTARRTAMVVGVRAISGMNAPATRSFPSVWVDSSTATDRAFTLASAWVLNINKPPVPITNLPSACFNAGIVATIILAAGLRLNFNHHVQFQAVASFAMLAFLTKRPCAKLMDSSGAGAVTWIARQLDRWARDVTDSVYGPSNRGGLMCPCLHVLVWMHVFVILVVGSYFLWKLERNSRRTFARTLPEQRRREEGLQIGFEDSVPIRLTHALLLMVAGAVVWEFSYPVVEAIQSWGL